jgi:tetratricopeptide (TPR) repeat protein
MASNRADVFINLGVELQQQGRLGEAIECYRAAIDSRPELPEAYVNLGALLVRQRKVHEARASFETALQLAPELTVAKYNLALIWLLLGEFDRGWGLFESRFKWWEENGNIDKPMSEPRWQGEKPEGRTILLVAEQGLGDTMQFIRYATVLARQGAGVIVECQPALVRLIRTVVGVRHVISRGESLPPYDAFCPLMSLPCAVNTTVTSIPAEIPYLRAEPALVAKWSARLNSSSAFLKVGLVWAGHPRSASPATAQMDRRRSFELDTYSPLFEVKGVSFYSLQQDQVVPVNDLPVTDFAGQFEDFADTAGLVEHLDLVITVDTAVAHLAGAMGKPVWLLSRFDGCWRWMLDRDDSPWYPTMSIFRQQSPGDWASVIGRVKESLERYAAESHQESGPRTNVAARSEHANESSAQPTLSVSEATKLAWRHYTLGNREEAGAIGRKVLAIEPTNAEALHLLGVLAYTGNLQDQAITFISAAIRSRKKEPAMHGNLALAKLAAGDLNGAKASARKALALKPSYADAHRVQGIVFYKQGKYREAILELERAITLTLGSPAADSDARDYLARARAALGGGRT